MTRPADRVLCADPVRTFVYEHLSSSFLREEPTRKGTCSVCGATGIDVVKMSQTWACRAQASLTQKRHTAAEGHPVALGAPLRVPEKAGRFSMVDKMCGILVEEDAAVFTGKVVPTRPLPPGAEIRTDLGFADLLEKVLADPKPPYFLAAFDQKGTMPLEMSTTAGTIVVNGTEPPVRLSRARILEILSLLTEFGVRSVEEAAAMRASVYLDRRKAAKIRASLAVSAPALLAVISAVPNGQEPEYAYATLLVRNRSAKARRQAASIETDVGGSCGPDETEEEDS